MALLIKFYQTFKSNINLTQILPENIKRIKNQYTFTFPLFFNFEIILDLHKSYKNSTENSHILFIYPFLNLHNHSTIIKTEKLALDDTVN